MVGGVASRKHGAGPGLPSGSKAHAGRFEAIVAASEPGGDTIPVALVQPGSAALSQSAAKVPNGRHRMVGAAVEVDDKGIRP